MKNPSNKIAEILKNHGYKIEDSSSSEINTYEKLSIWGGSIFLVCNVSNDEIDKNDIRNIFDSCLAHCKNIVNSKSFFTGLLSLGKIQLHLILIHKDSFNPNMAKKFLNYTTIGSSSGMINSITCLNENNSSVEQYSVTIVFGQITPMAT